jgi:hypothetical protein
MSVGAAFSAVLILASCSGGCGEGPGIDNMVASAERRLRITAPTTTFPHGDGTTEVDFEVSEVLGRFRQGPPHRETVAIHSSFVPGTEEALDDEGSVFLALSSSGLEREMVSFVIVRTDEGDHHFLGECPAEGEALLRARLGDAYDRTIERVIGATNERRILRLLGATEPG